MSAEEMTDAQFRADRLRYLKATLPAAVEGVAELVATTARNVQEAAAMYAGCGFPGAAEPYSPLVEMAEQAAEIGRLTHRLKATIARAGDYLDEQWQ